MALAVSRAGRGQAMLFFALLLPLVLIPAAALGAEASLLSARQARLEEVAVLAALDAAQQLDGAALRAGGPVGIDAGPAASTVRSDLAAGAPEASLDQFRVGPTDLSLAVSERVPLRLATFVPGGAVTLRARASARLRTGLAVPG